MEDRHYGRQKRLRALGVAVLALVSAVCRTLTACFLVTTNHGMVSVHASPFRSKKPTMAKAVFPSD